MRGENLKIGYLARVIREACLAVQDNLESAVEFLPRPRQQGSLWWLTGPGLFRLKWSRLPPAATPSEGHLVLRGNRPILFT